MEYVKHVFAILLFAVALYICKDAFPWLGGLLRPLPSGLFLGLVLAAVGLALGGVHRSAVHGPSGSRALAGTGVILLTFGVFMGAGAFTVIEHGGASTGGENGLPWLLLQGGEDDLEAKHDAFLAEARTQGKPVAIDFTADWCTACKELDAFTFTDPPVASKLRANYALLRIDLTKTTPGWLREKYQIFGLPLVVFIDPAGNERPEHRVTGYVPSDEFMPRL